MTTQPWHTPRPMSLRRAPYIGKAAYYLDPPDGAAEARPKLAPKALDNRGNRYR